jgi:hypothetical protein
MAGTVADLGSLAKEISAGLTHPAIGIKPGKNAAPEQNGSSTRARPRKPAACLAAIENPLVWGVAAIGKHGPLRM